MGTCSRGRGGRPLVGMIRQSCHAEAPGDPLECGVCRGLPLLWALAGIAWSEERETEHVCAGGSVIILRVDAASLPHRSQSIAVAPLTRSHLHPHVLCDRRLVSTSNALALAQGSFLACKPSVAPRPPGLSDGVSCAFGGPRLLALCSAVVATRAAAGAVDELCATVDASEGNGPSRGADHRARRAGFSLQVARRRFGAHACGLAPPRAELRQWTGAPTTPGDTSTSVQRKVPELVPTLVVGIEGGIQHALAKAGACQEPMATWEVLRGSWKGSPRLAAHCCDTSRSAGRLRPQCAGGPRLRHAGWLVRH